jgi:type II secretory pathway pseudopilin PulG
MAVASLILGVLSVPTLGCVCVGAITAIVLGIVALMRANREPQHYGGKGAAIGGIATGALALLITPVILFLLGPIAAIAIPSLLRARISANESAAIGDIRTVISAEAAYQSANNGLYDTLECLNKPQSCIPNYPANAPTFIDATLASGATKSGYRRTFHPGAPATHTEGASPSSLTAYAYVTEPLTPGQTGVRSFCGDWSGVICVHNDGAPFNVVGGACTACEPLR